MPDNRFFTSKPLVKGETISLEERESQHLRVMRRKTDDRVEIINGKGELGLGKISHFDRNLTSISIEQVEIAPPLPYQTILALAFLKLKNLDLVIEKGTELGATHFWLFPAECSEKQSLSPSQLHRFHRLSVSALKQCGRLHLPLIELKPPIIQWDQPPCLAFWGDLDSKVPLNPINKDTLILIGPEKGLSSQEKKTLQSLDFQRVALSSYTLRAETAALCALSQIHLPLL